MDNQEINVLMVIKKSELSQLANEKHRSLTEKLNTILGQTGTLFSGLSQLKEDVQFQIEQQQSQIAQLDQHWTENCNIDQEFAALNAQFENDMSEQEMRQLLNQTSAKLTERIQQQSESAAQNVENLQQQVRQLFKQARHQLKALARNANVDGCHAKTNWRSKWQQGKLALAQQLEKCALKLKTA